MSLLEKIESPKDLKKLALSQLPELCEEIRSFLLHSVSLTGGHLASNLGTIELTVALHYVFDSPKDRFIWDVGHQTYTHKILTGRRKKMETVRKFQGLSGFPKAEESPHDTYNSGHAGTSISLALGEAVARGLGQSKIGNIIAIIGDASIATGMAFEAINHGGHLKTPFLVILNDNEMSISKNVGSLSYILTSMINTRLYKNWRHGWIKFIHKIPLFGKIFERIMLRFRSSMKSILTEHQFFEEMGFRYLGPLDGHNVIKMVSMLRKLKTIEEPTILHVVTKKGKGYTPAENDPVKFHGVGPFEKATGDISVNSEVCPISEFVGRSLARFAQKDKKIVVITPAMTEGSGLSEFASAYPERFFDTGIAEQHASAFAASLGNSGLKPFLCIYSTFLQRGYDQLIHDIALMNHPVRIILDRAGAVGNDGETHHGLFDISFMASIPNLRLLSASNAEELIEMLQYMQSYSKGPIAVRFAKMSQRVEIFDQYFNTPRTPPKEILSRILRKGKDSLIITEGAMMINAMEAAKKLSGQGIELEVLSLRSLKPLDTKTLENSIKNHKYIFTLENHVHSGGVGNIIQNTFFKFLQGKTFHSFAYPDEFIEHGSIKDLEKKFKLDAEQIALQIKQIMKKK